MSENCGRCGKPADDGYKSCGPCREDGRRYWLKNGKAFRARRRAAGQCYLCGEPADEGYKSCATCRQQHAQRMDAWYWRLRQQVINHYGGRCICCGETEPQLLTIDHVNNDGGKRRKAGEPKAGSFLKWIIDTGFPDDLQLLCWNCNTAKAFYGQCPHQRKKNN